MSEKLEGSIVALITPFLGDGSIDWESYEGLLEWHKVSGTNGVLITGTTGEAPVISLEERRELYRRAKKILGDEVALIAGVGTNSTEGSVANSKVALEEGANYLLVVTPPYNKPNPAGLLRHYSEIAKLGGKIIVYNVPGRTGYNMPIDVFKMLFEEIEEVVALKEAAGSVDKLGQMKKAVPEAEVYSGDDHLYIPQLLVGADGVISVLANLIPQEMAKVHLKFKEGDNSYLVEFWQKYRELIRLLFVETNPIPAKAALYLMGKIKTYEVRSPLAPASEKTLELLKVELEKLGLI